MDVSTLYDKLKQFIKNVRDDIIDDVVHDIKDDLNDVYDDLEISHDIIYDDLILDVSLVQDSIGLLESGILSDISTDILLNFDVLKGIQETLGLQMDFSALVEPFKLISKFAIDLGIDSIPKGLLGQVGTIEALSIIMESIDDNVPEVDDFDKFLGWCNSAWSIVFGLKPFNIWLGKEGWVDHEKTSLYYDYMRLIAFGYIAFTVGKSAMESFFSVMIQQKIREHYGYSKLSISEYQRLDFRGSLNDNELKEVGYFLGYNERTMELIKKNAKFYPSVRDLIDFAVREAFEPDENLFIHDANSIPQPFIEYSDKLGIDIDWIKKFWHSHWRLLGSGQVLEGFHRGFVSKERLLDYLRRLDYVEKDRKLILDMSYNLLTRVDIRRIFENGLISSRELYDYYGKLGFDEKDKILMTDLAKQLRFIDTNDLRKLYIQRYENGLVNRNEITELLASTGLDTDDIKKYLFLSNSEKELEFILILKERIEIKYFDGDIDFDELVQQLRALGVSDQELKRIEKYATLYDFRKKKLPTITELKRYYKKNIISLTEFVYYALRIGYETDHIYWILTDMQVK